MSESPVTLFDVVVIGAGPAGENVADRAVRAGLTAAVVESELVGGECSYWACMPSKALLRPGQALDEARAVAGARQVVGGPLDVPAVLDRRDGFASHWADRGQVEWLDSTGITLIRGHGRLSGVRRVGVDGPDGSSTLEAGQAVVIATGSDAAVPPVAGLAASRPWTSRDATSSRHVPPELVVLGGGVVGCEMAQAWSSLGSRVTVVELGDRLLPGHEPFAGEMLAGAMASAGIDVRTGVAAEAVERDRSGRVTVRLAGGGSLEADEILVAAGRRPRTGDVGLEQVGLEPGSWLPVDDTMQVSGVPGGWLYAVGDVNHRALLTHQGKYQARLCGDVIAARARGRVDSAAWDAYSATADHAAVPSVVFTSPEVASVGHTEQSARQAGIGVDVVDYDLGRVAGASLYADGYRGRARMVVDARRRVVVGATFVGPGVAELLHAATVAVVGEVPLERLWHAVPSYPTISEVWLRLLEAYGL
ncbi:MAG TPA: NAD(P)/FAD-dependent oxidoreductase [Acidimicrobiales bacterium]|nr:NAD(P)/FAD-dependent oxidoreductase [Acidimicrobiales bacterium]